MPCLVKQRVGFVRQISVMKCQTYTYFVKGLQTDICVGQTEASLVKQIYIKLVLSACQGKEMVFGETDIGLKHLKILSLCFHKNNTPCLIDQTGPMCC